MKASFDDNFSLEVFHMFMEVITNSNTRKNEYFNIICVKNAMQVISTGNIIKNVCETKQTCMSYRTQINDIFKHHWTAVFTLTCSFLFLFLLQTKIYNQTY